MRNLLRQSVFLFVMYPYVVTAEQRSWRVSECSCSAAGVGAEEGSGDVDPFVFVWVQVDFAGAVAQAEGGCAECLEMEHSCESIGLSKRPKGRRWLSETTGKHLQTIMLPILLRYVFLFYNIPFS